MFEFSSRLLRPSQHWCNFTCSALTDSTDSITAAMGLSIGTLGTITNTSCDVTSGLAWGVMQGRTSVLSVLGSSKVDGTRFLVVGLEKFWTLLCLS